MKRVPWAVIASAAAWGVGGAMYGAFGWPGKGAPHSWTEGMPQLLICAMAAWGTAWGAYAGDHRRLAIAGAIIGIFAGALSGIAGMLVTALLISLLGSFWPMGDSPSLKSIICARIVVTAFAATAGGAGGAITLRSLTDLIARTLAAD